MERPVSNICLKCEEWMSYMEWTWLMYWTIFSGKVIGKVSKDSQFFKNVPAILSHMSSLSDGYPEYH